MNKPMPLVALLVGALVATAAPAGAARAQSSSDALDCYVGTSLFMLANLEPGDYPPHFYQLNIGYQLTPKDRISIEMITWRYYHPLGIPWGEERESAENAYPGHIRERGFGPAYQRTLWKGVYTSFAAIPFKREYFDANGKKIGDGSQLFLTLRLGYHLELSRRWFIEPSVAFNAWPITTHVPPGFAAMDEKWPSYFLFEPGLHIGYKF